MWGLTNQSIRMSRGLKDGASNPKRQTILWHTLHALAAVNSLLLLVTPSRFFLGSTVASHGSYCFGQAQAAGCVERV